MLQLALAAFLAPASAATERPCALDFVGTWELVLITRQAPDGKRDDAPFGKRPSEMLICTADGHTSVIISYDDRKPFSSNDRLAASVQEKATAFDTSFGYAGRYTCSNNRVLHHATIASVPNWVGTDMVRISRLTDGNGAASTWVLTWKRPK